MYEENHLVHRQKELGSENSKKVPHSEQLLDSKIMKYVGDNASHICNGCKT